MIPLDFTPPCADSWDLYDPLIEGRSGNEGMRATVQLCRSICDSCPIKAQCWTDNKDEDWVKRLRGQRIPTVQRQSCGTKAGANAHYKRGEITCEPCRVAASKAKAAQRERDALAGDDGIIHGTDTGYSMHRKKYGEPACDACKEAHALMWKIRKARKAKAA